MCPDTEWYNTKRHVLACKRDNNYDQETYFSNAEMHIEFKAANSQDPFNDPKEGKRRKTLKFERDSCREARLTRGQMTSYAVAQLGSQFRVFAFSVMIFGNFARLIRWDRAGAIVTEKFSYTENPGLLANFFWRYDHLSPEMRGVDPTVRIPDTAVATTARVQLGLNEGTQLVEYIVVDEETKEERTYIGVPRFASHSLASRATRGSPVYCVETGKVAYLKDTWRISLPDFLKEGETYKKLHAHHVPYIATVLQHGDVLNHSTETQNFRGKAWACKTVLIEPHSHYRLVLKEIGRDLTAFRSTKEYLTAITDAVEGTYILRVMISTELCLCPSLSYSSYIRFRKSGDYAL